MLAGEWSGWRGMDRFIWFGEVSMSRGVEGVRSRWTLFRRTGLTWALACWLALTGLALADTFGNLTYTVTPGWSQARQGNGLVFTLGGLPVGEQVRVNFLPGTVLKGDFAGWLAAEIRTFNAGATVVSQTPPQASTSDDGQPLLSSVAVVTAGDQTEWRFFIGAHPGNRGELIVITTSSLDAFTRHQNELSALTDPVQFANVRGAAGQGTAGKTTTPAVRTPPTQPPAKSAPATTPAQPAVTQPAVTQPTITQPPPTQSPSGQLPAVPVPNLAQLVNAGLNPEKQPIPDEFRCYLSYNSSDYSRPVFALQILPGGRYRAPGGEGRYTLTQTSGGSLNYLRWQGGPLAGTEDAFLLFDRTYGQRIQLDGVGTDERRLYCYQRGGSEGHALVNFRRNDPQVGAYACRSTDGKNTNRGTLELLAGRAYRYQGGSGKYSANILGKQGDSFSGIDFVGGPLDDSYTTYSEDELGEREFSSVGSNRTRCVMLAKPIAEPRFGQARAPAPPAGAGGLEGAYTSYVQNFYPSPGLNNTVYVFRKNGYVYTGEPEVSLDEADCTRTLPSGLPLCQVYTLKNGLMTIGSDKPARWVKTTTGYTLDGEALSPLRPLGNLTLSGEFKSVSSLTAVVGTGGGLFENFLNLRRDGTFTKTSSGGVSITTTNDGTALGDVTGGVTSSSSSKNSGTYSFAGNTLTLKYGDGRVQKLFAFMPGSDKAGRPDREWLYVGGNNYFLEKPGQ
jgi:hypothetical protein